MRRSLLRPPSLSYRPAEGGFLSAGDKGHPEAGVIWGRGWARQAHWQSEEAPNQIPADGADI